MFLGRTPDTIMTTGFAICFGGACHSLLSIPGQGVYVALTAIMSVVCAICAIDCWIGLAKNSRTVGRKG